MQSNAPRTAPSPPMVNPCVKTTFIASIAILGLSIIGLHFSASQLWSDAFVHQGQRLVNNWRQNGQRPSEDIWRIMESSLNTAEKYSAFPNPKTSELRGKLYEWAPNPTMDRSSRLNLALLSTLEAAAIRPDWPYDWLRVCRLLSLLQQFDSEFDHALHKAKESGGNQLETNYRIATLGIRHWNQLSLGARETVMKSIRIVTSVNTTKRLKLWDQIKKNGLNLIICQSLPPRQMEDIKGCWQTEHYAR